MGFFDFLSGGGDDIKKREELGRELYPHDRWCSRCYHMGGNTTEGFYCNKKAAQTAYTGINDGGWSIGNTREQVQRPLCDGHCFACWSLDDPSAENYMVNY